VKTHYSCAELAALKLPGLPTSKKGMIEVVTREKWAFQRRAGRGGGYEYQPPQAVIKAIQQLEMRKLITVAESTVKTVSTTVKTVSELTPVTNLKDWQRQAAEARMAICAEVNRLAEVGGKARAVETVVSLAASGRLPGNLQELVSLANVKPGESRTLSRSSVFRWLKDSEQGIAALAPRNKQEAKIPAWAPYLLGLYQTPQKPSLAYCMEQLSKVLPADVVAPSYHAADRFLKKMSKTEVQRGRMGSREIKNIKPFVRRDTSMLWPCDVYTADGHTFDAEVAHPAHGKAFRPELTTVLDVATRKAVGWSAGLAETTWGVMDALRHATTSCGIGAVFYVDNGKGFKNETFNAEATGFINRLGMTLTHSLPYNSQARGIEERSHQTIWVRGARELPTYMGDQMDREAKQQAFKVTRADIRLVGTSKLLMPWSDFLNWCQHQIDDYNNRPHSGLPKIYDDAGKRRHQTPNEAWAQAVSEGFLPMHLEADEVDDLFRPYKEAKVSRGEVRLHGNLYFHNALEHYHGETVRVGYDIHDASRVWVRNKAGQLICVAGFEANKRSYFPESFMEQAHKKRAEGRLRRADAKREEILEELDAPLLIEQQQTINLGRMAINTPREADRLPSSPDVQIVENGVSGNVIELPRTISRPMFDTDADKYRWLIGNAELQTKEDQGWLSWYQTTSEWEDIFGDIEVATR
jgi:putative transposase